MQFRLASGVADLRTNEKACANAGKDSDCQPARQVGRTIWPREQRPQLPAGAELLLVMRWTSRLLADPATLRCAAFTPANLSALKSGKVELFDHRRSLHYPPSGQRPRASPGGAGVSPVPMPLSWHAGSPNGLVPALEHNTADRAQRPGRKCAHMAERLVFLVSPSTLDGGAAQWMELAYADAFNVRTFVLLHHLRFHELKARAESHLPFPDQAQGQPQGSAPHRRHLRYLPRGTARSCIRFMRLPWGTVVAAARPRHRLVECCR